jgi:hypothetical protein
MIYILLNAVPILLATLAGLLAGMVVHRGRVTVGDAAVRYAAQVWFAAILAGALILAPPRAAAWLMAMGSAIVIWIGFVVPVTVVTLRQHRIGWPLVARDCGYWLLVMLVQALVLKTWGLVPPPV